MNEILTNVVNKAIATLDHIKSAIIRNGVEVPEGSSTATYADKIDEVFDAGEQATYDAVNPEIERLNARMTGDESESKSVYDEVFEAGKKAEYDAFWDVAQDYGRRTEYSNAYSGKTFNNENFHPKYNMYCESRADNMFLYSAILNIRKSCEDAGVILDFSKATNLYQVFANCSSTEIGVVDATSAVSLYSLFHQARKLVRIEKLILKNTPYDNVNNVFNQNVALESVAVEGSITQNGYNFAHAPLNKASLTSIVNALSATTTGLTVTLRLDAVNKAFETSEGAMDGSTSDEWLALAATKANWTISLINS